MPEKTTFSWKNYFKPTPDNLTYLASSLKGITIVIAGSAWASGNPHIGMIVMVTGAVLDELAKFFAKVSQDMKEESNDETTPKA